MSALNKQSLDGNVETIILSHLAAGPNYGYALVRTINEHHQGVLALGEGTIYPVLYRMEEKGLLKSEVLQTASGRDRKYYSISDKGRGALRENLKQWAALSEVMQRVQEMVKPLQFEPSSTHQGRGALKLV